MHRLYLRLERARSSAVEHLTFNHNRFQLETQQMRGYFAVVLVVMGPLTVTRCSTQCFLRIVIMHIARHAT